MERDVDKLFIQRVVDTHKFWLDTGYGHWCTKNEQGGILHPSHALDELFHQAYSKGQSDIQRQLQELLGLDK